jgi:hypothetical protein
VGPCGFGTPIAVMREPEGRRGHGPGAHTPEVRARDRAGNVSPYRAFAFEVGPRPADPTQALAARPARLPLRRAVRAGPRGLGKGIDATCKQRYGLKCQASDRHAQQRSEASRPAQSIGSGCVQPRE